MRAGLRLGDAAHSATACHYAAVSFPERKPLPPSATSACRRQEAARLRGAENPPFPPPTPFAPRRQTRSFSSLRFNCPPSWLLHRASLLQPRRAAQVARLLAHAGTKHSISASDITAVSSAVSACAINSAAERANWLCRKDLTPDPERRGGEICFLHG